MQHVDGREFLIVGTAHISRESADLVREVIEKERPDCVCVELDAQRYEALSQKRKFEELDLRQLIRNKQLAPLLANMLLASYQKKLGGALGILPGTELLEATEAANEYGIPVALCDRDVRVTLRRAWASMGFFKKVGLLSTLAGTEDSYSDSALAGGTYNYEVIAVCPSGTIAPGAVCVAAHTPPCDSVLSLPALTTGAGVPVTWNPRQSFEEAAEANKFLIPDAILYLLNKVLWVDASVISAVCPSNVAAAAKKIGAACCKRENEKNVKYLEPARAKGCDFKPLVFETHGRHGAAVRDLLRKIVSASGDTPGVTTSDMLMRLMLDLVRGNALMARDVINKSRVFHARQNGAQWDRVVGQ